MDNNNIKRIATNTVYLYVRMLITMIVSLITVRIVLKSLGETDYGIYSSIAGVITSLSFISNVLANASQRFFSYEIGSGNNNRVFGVFSTILITYIAISAFFVVVSETAGIWFVFNKMNFANATHSTVQWVFQFALASFVITLLANPFQALIIANEKMNVYAYLAVAEVFMKLLVAFLLVSSPIERLKFYSLLLCLSSLIVNSCYVFVGRKYFLKGFDRLVFEKNRFADIFKYTSWTLFGSLSYMFKTQGLNILLNMFYGPVANAAYSISANVSSAVNGLATNFFAAVRPPLIKSYAQNDRDSMLQMFRYSSKIMFALLFIIAFPLSVRTETILTFWLGEVSPYMVSFVRLVLIDALILRLSEPITVLFQAANKVKVYHGIVDSFTLLSLPLAYLALKCGARAESVFISSIVVFSAAHIFRVVLLKRYIFISVAEYFKEILFPISVAIMISVLLIYLFNLLVSRGMLVDLLIIFCAFIISSAISWIVIFNKKERNKIICLFRK